MDKDRLIKRLMVTFLGELEEHVRTLNRDLLALEKEPEGSGRADQYQTLFRTVHSLKGAARSVSIGPIVEVCHRLEELLLAAQEGQMPLGPGQFALLFETADAIEEAGMRLREQQELGGSPLVALLPRLDATAARAATAPSAPAAGPAPSSAPVSPPVIAAEAPEPPPAPIRPAPPPAAPAPVAATAEKSHPDPTGGASVVRVPAEKLDAMLTRSGELLVARRRVESRGEDMAALREFVGRLRVEWRDVEPSLTALLGRDEPEDGDGEASDRAAGLLPRRTVEVLRRAGDNFVRLERDVDRLAALQASDRRQLARAARQLDEGVRRIRMLPFAEACQGLERSVRDLAAAGGKQVELVIEGGDVELDRSILEGLKDPLVHLVSNAVDHGIDSPERRREAGKPPRATVTVAAALRGGQVEVVVADDGRGLDLDALREQARKRGLAEPSDPRDVAHLIFLPGLSTARIITNVSGRGVGLDAVKGRLEQLHGTIDLETSPGRGTRFTLAVPLTLTTLRAVLVSAGGQVFAVATTNVQKLVRVDPGAFGTVEGREVLALGGPPLPVASLAETLGLPSRKPANGGGKVPGLIISAGERRIAVLVDELMAEQEVVVKGLGARVRRIRNYSGSTILPSGRVALVLNAAHLVRTALGQGRGAPLARTLAGATPEARKRLLVVDDSVTTRTLEKSILEAAGYDVTVAVDGEDGWRQLQEKGADLLISDVEMPRMDGFSLARTVRGSDRFAELPIVLFTSLGSERDKARGVEVGANAYLVKGGFDQKDLLETVAQLV
jgi:two-component system chemotaxis sensor kinase CheA